VSAYRSASAGEVTRGQREFEQLMEEWKKKKVPMREQPVSERIHNFDEVPYGYSVEEAVKEASRCLQCKNPKCVAGCPVGVDIKGFIGELAKGNLEASARIMKQYNSLPAICGRVCPQENQCEQLCILGKLGQPGGIGRLERFIADWERSTGVKMPERAASKRKKVAVVGSGPAGLTCAGDLAKMGYDVTVFETLHVPGGVLVYGIPEFRLPKEIVAQEIDYIKRLGVEIQTNMPIGLVYTIDELFQMGYKAVFVGTGAGLPSFMRIPGENLIGIYSANEFLTRVNLMKAYLFPEYDTPVRVGEKVAVIGAGNVAMDSARVALRLGAKDVKIVYRRSDKEIPARMEEVEHAKEEGIQFCLLTAPIRYFGDDQGAVRQMEVIHMELGEPDESGRRSPVPIPGSEEVLEADTVIVAIGQRPNPLIPNTTPQLKTGRHGNIVADLSTGRTSMEGVFAGGDIVTGAATVISAMGAGKAAAAAIDEYLR